MYCKKCNRDVEKPLELYNGQFACSYCKEKLALDLNVDANNQEQFELSEISFHRALEKHRARGEFTKRIAKAVSLCKAAAFSGHPKALVRLAYYYEMGYVNADEVASFKAACEYYQLVWSNPFTNTAIQGYSPLRQIAVNRHLALLERAPKSLAHNNKYLYSEVVRQIRAQHNLTIPPRDKADEHDRQASSSARVSRILDSCFAKGRAPLFGLIALRGGELRHWATAPKTVGKETLPCCEYYTSKIDLFVIQKNSQYDEPIAYNFTSSDIFAANNSRDISISNDGTYYLCFLNHKVKKYGKISKILDPVEDDKQQLLFELVRKKPLDDYIFYVDDVVYYRRKMESLKHALTDLIDAVCNDDQ